jgi:hypothetical protein
MEILHFYFEINFSFRLLNLYCPLIGRISTVELLAFLVHEVKFLLPDDSGERG